VTDADATRGRVLVEESREAIVVIDDSDRVLHASRRARQAVDGLREGEPLPADLLTGERGVIPLVVPYEVNGRRGSGDGRSADRNTVEGSSRQ